MGASHRARHDRARRHPDVPLVHADIDPGVHLRSDYGEATSPTSSCRCCSSRADRESRLRARVTRALPADPAQKQKTTHRSRQAILPPRLRRAEGRGSTKRLAVSVSANKEEYRPANQAALALDVKDAQNRGVSSEVTLWAVDYGVLSLTSYQTPDILGSVYVRKSLQVFNVDSRQRIVSRRVLTPKGDTDGGGGGADAGAGTLRKDFRVLAFWLGSVTTDRTARRT